MYKKPLEFHVRQCRGEAEVIVCRITNSAGLRVFANGMPPGNARSDAAAVLFDGDDIFSGAETYGVDFEDVLDFGGRVLTWGALRETLVPDRGDLLVSQQTQEVSTSSITLNNADRYFSKMLGRENLISAEVEILAGFNGIAGNEYMEQFTGQVSKVTLTQEKVSLNLRAI